MELNVKEGKLYFGSKLIGASENTPGFSQYIFDSEPLGSYSGSVVKTKI